MLEFALTSLLIELTPGPNMAYLAAVAVAHGRRRALSAVAGVALGLAIIGTLAAFGLAALVQNSALAYQLLRYAGAVYLLWLAWDAWRDPPEGAVGESGDFASFKRGLATNLLNPKAAAFYVAVLPGFIDPAQGDVFLRNLFLVAIYVAVATAVHAAIALSADRVRPWLVANAGERLVRRALALALAVVAIWFLYSTRR